MAQTVTIQFTGRLVPESFAAFVRHRAERLALDHGHGAFAADGARVTVRGAPDLVDAFEVACSLGPIDCLVLDTTRIASAPSGDLP